jgi:hypothetical protein
MEPTTTGAYSTHARRLSLVILAMTLIAAWIILPAHPAAAYATNGCKWPTNNLNINTSSTTGVYTVPLGTAIGQWSANTDVNLAGASSGTFAARNGFYGANGYAGYANTTCPFGATTSVDFWVNEYYAQSYTAEQKRVLWGHELGHGLGLAHVTPNTRLMHDTPINAYNQGGVRGPTTDDINGMNSLY